MNTFEKIHSNPKTLQSILNNYREQGKTIVFGNGCFDLLHVGHVRYMEDAKNLGDILVMAVNTDSSIRSNVGREPAINDFYERMELVAALAAVDFVVPLEASTPISLIELLRPHIQAKGTDYEIDQMPERFAVEAVGGRIEFVGDQKTHSSSALREALREKGII